MLRMILAKARNHKRLISTIALWVLVLGVAALLRVWGMNYGLPFPTARPDEERIVGRALNMMATGNLHPGDYTYPGLSKYLNVAGIGSYVWTKQALGHYGGLKDFLFDVVIANRGLQYRICRSVSVLFGVLTVLATFGLCQSAYRSQSTGLLAASVVATNVIHVRDSHFATVDAVMTFFVVISLWFAVRVARDFRTADFIGAGVFAGMAAATKYNAGMVALGLVVACITPLLGRPLEGEIPGRGVILKRLLIAGVLSAVTFAICTPYSLIYAGAVAKELNAIRNVLYEGEGTRAIWIHLRVTFPEGLGWPFFIAAVLGLGRALWLRRPGELVLLAFFIPSFASAAGVRWIFPRYITPYVPLLAVMAAEFCYIVVCRSKAPATLAVGLILAGPGLYRSALFDQVASQKDTRVLAAEWVEANVPPRSEILLCRGYGAPKINSDRRRAPSFVPREIACAPAAVAASEARFLITHEHPSLHSYSGVTERMRRYLDETAKPLVVLDPFKRPKQMEPYFYDGDAFYLPFTHLGAMERGGPILTVWEVSRNVDDPSVE